MTKKSGAMWFLAALHYGIAALLVPLVCLALMSYFEPLFFLIWRNVDLALAAEVAAIEQAFFIYVGVLISALLVKSRYTSVDAGALAWRSLVVYVVITA